MRKFRSRSSSACERSGERSAVMSCATNWPRNGQPAATVASSLPSVSSASLPSQAPPAAPIMCSSASSAENGGRSVNMRP